MHSRPRPDFDRGGPRESRDFDRSEMHSRPRPDFEREDRGRNGRRDERGGGPRERSFEEEGPSDWRSAMAKPREPPQEDFVRAPYNPPREPREDREPVFER